MESIQAIMQGACDLVQLVWNTGVVAMNTAGTGVHSVLQVLHLVK